MYLLKLCSFLVIVSASQSARQQDFVVVKSIKRLLTGHFAVHQPKVDLLFYGKNSEKLTQNILRENCSGVHVRVVNVGSFSKVPIKSPSIILFDSADDFEKALRNQNIIFLIGNSWKNVAENHVIYAPQGRSSLQGVLMTLTKPIDNQNFLHVVNDSTVDLISGFMFSQGKCRKSDYKVVDRFSTSTMQWQNKSFFPEKYANFNNCSLVISHMPGGRPQILKITAEKLNFWPQHKNFNRNDRNFDVLDHINFQNFLLFENFEFSPPLFSDQVTLTVPAGEPYTQLEKMFLMFDKDTWICIGITIAGSALIIQIINFMSDTIKIFVFGRYIQTPTLNLLNIFLNGGQIKVPGRNFARFLLMMFIMWSLVIRTCYQSILYENLQRDMRKPRMTTVDELLEHNFTLMFQPGAGRIWYETIIKRQVVCGTFNIK